MKMSRGMEGIGPEVESASLAGAWARGRVVGYEITGAGRLRSRNAKWDTEKSLYFIETMLGSHRNMYPAVHII